MNTIKFEWDARKDKVNEKKHGVSFSDAQCVFLDPKRVIAKDLKHNEDEARYYCFGKLFPGSEIITVRFTYRGNVIRIIGAGYWREGRKTYEEKNKI